LPLTDALRGSPRHLTVTAEMTAAVAAAKDALAAATGLAHPLPHAQLALVTDASDSHVGGVLRADSSVFCPSAFSFYAGRKAVPRDD
jgi:RNase H-like domain found in reverse transcriptase